MSNCDCVPVRLCLDELPAASSGLPVYPGMFMSFFEQTPPDGWEMRDGRILYNADRVYPELWNELLKPKNAWKLKSDEEWEEMSLAASGVGGVPFFALNQQPSGFPTPAATMNAVLAVAQWLKLVTGMKMRLGILQAIATGCLAIDQEKILQEELLL